MSLSEPTIPARPTTYRGIPMRSRTEARFAALLDELGVIWEYEPRAFASRNGQYLPDFYLPAGGKRVRDIYIEVKPTIVAAMGALERMQIIWESDSEAELSVYADREAVFLSGHPKDRVWRVG